jgi:hypothetical protein
VLTTGLLDPVPIVGVFLLFAVVLYVVFEVGFQLGRWWQRRTPDHKEGPTAMLVGSLLGLLAFLLAVTMGMAADRFDTRRALVLQEANAIGTTYLRAGFLEEPGASRSKALLREYVPLRVNTSDRAQYLENEARSLEILEELWTLGEDRMIARPADESISLYIQTLNETIDLQTSRSVAVVQARVPETILVLLFLGQVLTLGVVGYSAGLTGSRGMVSAIVLVVVLSAVLTIVIDLDRPRDGFLQVSQAPLLQLSDQLDPP